MSIDEIEVLEEESLFDCVLIRLVVKPTKEDFGIPVKKSLFFKKLIYKYRNRNPYPSDLLTMYLQN